MDGMGVTGDNNHRLGLGRFTQFNHPEKPAIR